jgi:hypothetical protein
MRGVARALSNDGDCREPARPGHFPRGRLHGRAPLPSRGFPGSQYRPGDPASARDGRGYRRMNAIIDQFIDFMRSGEGRAAVPDQSRRARRVVARASAHLASRCAESSPRVTTLMRPLAMQRLVDNLLGNAAAPCRRGSAFRTERIGARPIVSILDRGPRIPEAWSSASRAFTHRDGVRSGSSGPTSDWPSPTGCHPPWGQAGLPPEEAASRPLTCPQPERTLPLRLIRAA